jgi:hypothetical protein
MIGSGRYVSVSTYIAVCVDSRTSLCCEAAWKLLWTRTARLTPLNSQCSVITCPVGGSHSFGYCKTELWDFFCGEGPCSRCYVRAAALRLIVQPCDEDD